MINLLWRLFCKTRHELSELVTNNGDHVDSNEEERERRMKELQQREHDATNRLHVLEWQAEVRGRKYEEQKEKEKS